MAGSKEIRESRDRYHNSNGPSIEWANGTKFWYFDGIDGMLHREDGAAIEWADGTKEYYLFGQKCETKAAYKDTLELLRLAEAAWELLRLVQEK